MTTSPIPTDPAEPTERAVEPPPPRRDYTRYLYLAVIVAVVLGIAVGFLFPDVGKALKPIGTGFVNLIKMTISPDANTLFIAGANQLVVQPTPAL